MNSPFFAVEAYVPGRSRIRPKKIRKMPSGTKIDFSKGRTESMAFRRGFVNHSFFQSSDHLSLEQK